MKRPVYVTRYVFQWRINSANESTFVTSANVNCIGQCLIPVYDRTILTRRTNPNRWEHRDVSVTLYWRSCLCAYGCADSQTVPQLTIRSEGQ